MKKVSLVFLVILCFGLVNANTFSSITGKVIDEINADISQMSEEELAAFYEEHKDDITAEELQELYEENKDKLPDEAILLYEENQDLITDEKLESIGEDLSNFDIDNLDVYFSLLTCSLIKEVIEEDFLEIELPDEIPMDDVIVDLYLEDEFLFSAEIENKKAKGIYCDENDDVDFQIYITNDFIISAAENYQNMNYVEFYQEQKKSGDLEIKAKGLGNKLKLLVVNIAVKFF